MCECVNKLCIELNDHQFNFCLEMRHWREYRWEVSVRCVWHKVVGHLSIPCTWWSVRSFVWSLMSFYESSVRREEFAVTSHTLTLVAQMWNCDSVLVSVKRWALQKKKTHQKSSLLVCLLPPPHLTVQTRIASLWQSGLSVTLLETISRTVTCDLLPVVWQAKQWDGQVFKWTAKAHDTSLA